MASLHRWHRLLKSFFIIFFAFLLVFALPPQRSEVSLSEDLTLAAFSGEAPADLLSALPLQFMRNPEPGIISSTYPWAQAGGGLLLGPGSLLYRMAVPAGVSSKPGMPETEPETQVIDIPVAWIGSLQQPRMDGSDLLPGKVNLFQGSDPQGWHTNLPSYGGVRYEDLYPGIHLLVQGSGGQLESFYRVEKNADPSQIRWRYPQGFDLQVDEATGDLLVSQGGRLLLTEKAPQAWQTAGQQRLPVPVGYQVQHNEVSFKIGSYDPSDELVIDPVIVLSTYFGNGTYRAGYAIEVDDDGFLYITGALEGNKFYVSKINPLTGSFVYSSIFTPANYTDVRGMTLDRSGAVYITGATSSDTYPLVNALQTSCPGEDAFVTKIAPDGISLLFSTYLCGNGDDSGDDIVVDALQRAYLIGHTISSDIPVTVGALDTTLNGSSDLFFAILDTVQPASLAVSYLGGNQMEYGNAIRLDNQGNIYLAGFSTSTDYPTLNPISLSHGGDCDGVPCEDIVLTKLTPAGNALVYSTYLGGSASDYVSKMEIDSSGNAYLAGRTYSADFPWVTLPPIYRSGPFDSTSMFIAKVNASGNGLIFSTILGGVGSDEIHGLNLLQTTDGFAVAGTYQLCFPPFSYTSVAQKGIYMQFDPTGSLNSYLFFGGGYNYSPLIDMAMDDQDSAYLLGYPYAGDTFRLVEPFTTTPTQVYLMKIAQTRPLKPGQLRYFLPFTTYRTGIYGWVTEFGCGVAGIPLELRYFNGTSWSTRLTTTTAADGKYTFIGVPPLNSGEAYYVRYYNSTNSDRVWSWGTRILTAYQAGSDVAIGNFEIQNPYLSSPENRAQVSLPYRFAWNRRGYTPSDSYDLNLVELDGEDYWYTPPLGYVNNYTLSSLPDGFLPTHPIAWYVGIHSPDGGYGEGYDTRLVYFHNSGLVAAEAQALPESALLKRLDQLERKRLQEIEQIP